MKTITLTSAKNFEKLYFTIPNGGVQWVIAEDEVGRAKISDGIHNNGGWVVVETPETVLKMLNETTEN